MSLEVLGLGHVEHRVYEHLVRRRALAPDALCSELGMRSSVVGQALDALAERGLVARDAAGEERVIAAPPDVALGALILKHEDQLRRAEAEMLLLEQEYRDAGSSEAQFVDLVRGPEAVRHRFNQLQRSAQREVLLFIKGDAVAVERDDNVEEALAIERGVRYRYLLERSRLEAPGLIEAVRSAISEGLDVRVTTELPTRLLIVDRAVAMVPLAAAGQDQSTGALLLHAGGLVNLAIDLFESRWLTASRLTADPTGSVTASELAPEEREVLAMLDLGLTDRAIATRAGVSMRTVQRRVRDLMDRADVETRLQLGVVAVRRGWL
ncbi:helix-turn-helix transcriptional regulator [Demequina zhanjiangensis]|uniref:Helix-turn-helix domain-containing protein n=1 Tax=Demequina zhanjiangensis TaxID=3051659 RepID=A0ABT8G1B5_9MICO|nr:LuxR family transcriptional regulator [Demequina sp. SYSU T00b26]MDN4472913.1 helix-turn-helix domain-containing protein [Demequina sp. SYSU T00b26]